MSEKEKKHKYHHVRVPVVMQMENVECGAASLCMILAYYGKYIPLEQVRKDCGVSRDGSKASLIVAAAENYGLIADGYRYSVESCMTKVSFPAIIHWNLSHFVVLRGFGKGKAYLNDPAFGEITVTMEEFNKSFTGIVLQFSPGENFEKSGERPSVTRFFGTHLKTEKSGMAFVILNACVIAMIGLVVPVFQSVFTDKLLSGYQIWQQRFFFFILLFGLIELLTDTLNQIMSYRIKGSLAIRLSTDFFKHLLRLPMDFFLQRSPGELIGRISLNTTVATTLFDKIAPVFIQFLMAVFYLAAMLYRNPVMTLISVFFLILNITATQFASHFAVRSMQYRLNSQIHMDAEMVSGIDMVETIKASGVEGGYFSRWASCQASVNEGKTRENRVLAFFTGFPQLCQDITTTVVLAISAHLIMDGDMTAGSFLAFQTLVTRFSEPARNLSDTGKQIREMTTSVDKVQDVMRYEEDTAFNVSSIPEGEELKPLSGDISFEHVTFGYNKAAKPLITDMNFKITPGEVIAFVGASGCGKSTIAKLLTGINLPWEGKILFDGKDRYDIPEPVFRSCVSMVSQESTLFADSISNNVRMWDTTITNVQISLAANEAQIRKDILDLPGTYDYMSASGGRNFSGGQCQRISIARALAREPRILIMDEATSALDAATEDEVMKAIRRRGITLIIIAHRLSTVRDCDRIYVLEEGKIVEEGKHDELIEKQGRYYELVSMA